MDSPSKKRTHSGLVNELDGSYWSISGSSSRTKRPVPTSEFVVPKPRRTKSKPNIPDSPQKQSATPVGPSSPQNVIATSVSTPLSVLSAPASPQFGSPSILSVNPSPAQPSSVPSTPTVATAAYPATPKHTSSSQPSTPTSLSIASSENNPDLDGSYWASFDPNQKRKRERVLSDITSAESDYWNKRNSKVQIKKKAPPTTPTDEQLALRKERAARVKEELRVSREAEHARLSHKQEESRVGKEVYKGVYLGSRHAAKNWEFFESHQIHSVVNVTCDLPNYHEKNDSRTISYIKIPVADLPTVELLDIFEKVAVSIHDLTARGNVLIHCREGKSRSPSICMAYAMKYLNMNLADAHNSITEKSEIRLNIGFQQQLMSYERRIFNVEINSYNFLKQRNRTPPSSQEKAAKAKSPPSSQEKSSSQAKSPPSSQEKPSSRANSPPSSKSPASSQSSSQSSSQEIKTEM